MTVRMATFELTLHKTYFHIGFFNVPVRHDAGLGSVPGPLTLVLVSGNETRRLAGRFDRSANRNATPRVHGGAELARWFQRHADLLGRVAVEFVDPDTIRITAGAR